VKAQCSIAVRLHLTRRSKALTVTYNCQLSFA
jgi:hypothetical protein